MEDVLELAKTHNLEGEIYYGNQLPKIVAVLDSKLQDDWYEILSKEEVSKTSR